MSLHGLLSVTIGVPNVDQTAAYYADFGLAPGSRQLVQPPPTAAGSCTRARADPAAGRAARRRPTTRTTWPHRGQPGAARLPRRAGRRRRWRRPSRSPACGSGWRSRRRLAQDPVHPVAPTTGRAASTGRTARAPRLHPARIRSGRASSGTPCSAAPTTEASTSFFTDGLGFKVSDRIKGAGAFMRCSTDHHNVLVLGAPVNFLHHTSWQVDDVDDVGRGAHAMLDGNPERHVWGLGRHYAGSNFFWYLKDPAGNFSEYYSDMDCIVDDQLWTPEDLEGARGLFAWGPPPPPSFLQPDDLAAMMTGAHAPG